MQKIIAVLTAFALAGMTAAIAQAPAPAAAPTAAPIPPTPRQAVMQSNRTAAASYSAITISNMESDAARAAAQTLIDNGGKIATLFAAGTDQNDPRAQPAIWTDTAGFKAGNDRFIANARKLQAAIPDRLAMAVAMRELQADCAECHKTYRVPLATTAGGRGRGAAAN